MGTDISFVVEKRGPEGWARVENLVDRPIDLDPRESWYETRSRELFTILAGVYCPRPMSENAVINPPRGVPDDASEETATQAAIPDSFDHSWFTVAELKQVDWDLPISHTFSLRMFEPSDLSFDDAADHIARLGHPPPGWATAGYSPSGEKVTIETTRRKVIDPHFFSVIDRMAALAGQDMTSVRAVFWFDA